MTKHPVPWTMGSGGFIRDARNISLNAVCMVMTSDPETRAVLLHAAEMFAALKVSVETRLDPLIVREDFMDRKELVDKIEDEVAKARKP